MQINDATRQATAPGKELDERISSMAVLGAEDCTAADGQTKTEGARPSGMEAVVERYNLWQAVQGAQGYIREGRRWVVDLDLAKFLDLS